MGEHQCDHHLEGSERVRCLGDLTITPTAGNWGTSGSNGGTVDFTADGETLTGNVIADAISSVSLTLQTAESLRGAINTDHTAKGANLSLDGTST